MSYANMDAVPTQTAGTSELLASDWNTYVRDNFDSIKFGHVVCTSGTRPTGIAEGTMIYETDTQKVLVYSGSSWIEISDLDNTGTVSDAAVPFLSPVGSITAYAGSSAPTGWLLCDGTAVSRSTYSVLFGVLSTAYGSGDGSTTFNVPDLRGRVAVGKGTNADVDTLGDSDGVATVADRRPKHKHTVNDPTHSHSSYITQVQNLGGDRAYPGGGDRFGFASTGTSSSSTGITVGLQSNTPTDGPAYLTVNYIIKF